MNSLPLQVSPRSGWIAPEFKRACTEAEMEIVDFHVDPDGIRAEPV